mgnify:CR=1 FL=1
MPTILSIKISNESDLRHALLLPPRCGWRLFTACAIRAEVRSTRLLQALGWCTAQHGNEISVLRYHADQHSRAG